MIIHRTTLVGVAALVVAGAILLPANESPGQVVTQSHAVWESFYDGCVREAPDQAYTCACSATLMITQCEQRGQGQGEALAQCLRSTPVDPAVQACTAYGRLSTGGLATPGPVVNAPPPPPGSPAIPRLQRWVGAFQGCMQQATPEERRRAPSLKYTCACISTYIVNMCAPTDGTSNDQVTQCIQARMPQVQAIAPRCDAYGSLRMR